MMNFLPAIGVLLTFGSCSAVIKKSINQIGKEPTIILSYLILVTLLVVGAIILKIDFKLGHNLVLPYLALIIAGATGAIAYAKALECGQASVVPTVAKTEIIIILFVSMFFLGEELSVMQICGVLLIVASVITINIGSNFKFQYGKWMPYIGIAILSRVYYFTAIKFFIAELGPYKATLLLEIGITIIIVIFYYSKGKKLLPDSSKHTKFALLAGMLMFAGSLLYSWSISIVGVSITASIAAGSPATNACLSFFLLKEKLNLHKYIAIILVVVGLIIIALF
jgi:uncharacterized membrane protein